METVPIIVQEEPFGAMFARLRQFERWRCWWRLPIAGLLYAVVPLFFIGATVLAAFIAGNDFDLTTAIIAAVVALGATYILGPRLSRRQLHRRIIAGRLWRYEAPNPATSVEVLIREPDLDAARTALRRAKFNPRVYSAGVGSPPLDAANLNHRFGVEEPAAWPQSASDADRVQQIARVLGAAGIRARVDGIDTLLAAKDREPNDGRTTDVA